MNVSNNCGAAAIMLAAQNGSYKSLELLINAGASVNTADRHGNRLLYKQQSMTVLSA